MGWTASTADVRRLFLLLALVSLVVTWPSALAHATGGSLALTALGSLMLVGSWVAGYRAERAPLALDLLDAAGLALFALGSVAPEATATIAFPLIWFRSLYGSTWRGVLRAALYAAALLGTLPVWTLVPWHPHPVPPGPMVGVVPSMFLTVVVGRVLGEALARRDRDGARDAALAALGPRLLGLTDHAEIREAAARACTEICRATPGLRLLEVEVRDTDLPVLRSAGPAATAPGSLPRAVLGADLIAEQDRAIASAQSVPAHPDLDTAAGGRIAWLQFRLPGDPDRRLLMGHPGGVPDATLVAIQGVINQTTLALQQSHRHQELTSQASTDPLTGLGNRTAFAAALSAALHRPEGHELVILFIDLDDFKDVNDTMGHHAGDQVLVEVATRLTAAVRSGDAGFRLGGDEFAVLLLGAGTAEPESIAQRIVEAVAAPVTLPAGEARIGASVGLAFTEPWMLPEHLDELVQRADVAMYAAKAQGKGRIQVFRPGLLEDTPAGLPRPRTHRPDAQARS